MESLKAKAELVAWKIVGPYHISISQRKAVVEMVAKAWLKGYAEGKKHEKLDDDRAE